MYFSNSNSTYTSPNSFSKGGLPRLGPTLSPDPFVQNAANLQNFNRYSYGMNNPLVYTDPSGEFFWMPIIIGAVIGTYIGGTLANNDYNPKNWDYNSNKTWGYMAGGAIAGGLSGYVGGALAASEIPMANTLGIAGASFTNSVGTFFYTGGKTDIGISFGIASYNFSTGNWGYLGKKGNSTLENIGYGFGAFANVSDIYSVIMGAYGNNVGNVELQSDNHSSIYDKNGNALLDVGAKKPRSTITAKEGISGNLDLTMDYRNHQASIGENISHSIWNRRQSIHNVRLDKLAAYKAQLAISGKGYGLLRLFGGSNINCAGGAAMGLLKSGVFNVPIGVPGLLSMQMYARQFSYLSFYLTDF